MIADLGDLVASPHFRWMPGMHTVSGNICVSNTGTPLFIDPTSEGRIPPFALRSGFGRPLLSNSATRGCLLHLVREAWGDPCIHVCGDGVTWAVCNGNLDEIDVGTHFEEWSALRAALLAAPPKGGE